MADNSSDDGFAIRDTFAFLNSAEASGNSAAGLHVEKNGTAVINDCVFVGYGAGVFPSVYKQGDQRNPYLF